jgi:hypothetical protein
MLDIFGKAPSPPQRCDGPFDHPSHWQNGAAFLIWIAAHEFEPPGPCPGDGGRGIWTLIPLIGEHDLD